MSLHRQVRLLLAGPAGPGSQVDGLRKKQQAGQSHVPSSVICTPKAIDMLKFTQVVPKQATYWRHKHRAGDSATTQRPHASILLLCLYVNLQASCTHQITLYGSLDLRRRRAAARRQLPKPVLRCGVNAFLVHASGVAARAKVSTRISTYSRRTAPRQIGLRSPQASLCGGSPAQQHAGGEEDIHIRLHTAGPRLPEEGHPVP